MSDFLIGTGVTILISALSSFLLAWVKKGQFEDWGKKVGRMLSSLGNTKLGKDRWEKIEDTFTLSILSFAKGVKLGADEDDDGKLDRIEDKIKDGDSV